MKKCGFTILLLIALAFMLHPEKIAVLEGLEKPRELRINGKYLFVSHLQSVNVYELNTSKFFRRLGREGKGPGEFETSPRVFFSDNDIKLIDKDKIARFSYSFKYLDEFNLGMSYWGSNQIVPVSNHFVVDDNDVASGKKSRTFLLIDKKKRELKRLIKEFHGYETQKYLPMSWSRIRVANDKIFIAQPHKGLYIEVFDKTGTLIYKIDKRVKKIKSTQAHLKLYKDDMLFMNGRKVFDMATKIGFFKKPLPEFMPIINNFWVIGDFIYVKSYEIDGNREKYIIMDLEGNIKRTLYLPVTFRELITFNHGVMYYIIDNEETENWELHRIKL